MDYLDVYTKSFAYDSYSNEHHIQYDFVLDEMDCLDLNPKFKFIDVGSGRGQLIRIIRRDYPECLITSVDVDKFHNVEVDEFIQCDLSKEADRAKIVSKYDVLACTDVLEHLDKSFIDDVIKMFSERADMILLAIANHSDILNDIELHTIQENDIWWENVLTNHLTIHKKGILYDGILYLYVCTPKTT